MWPTEDISWQYGHFAPSYRRSKISTAADRNAMRIAREISLRLKVEGLPIVYK
jgi:hypothetical protein